MGEEKLSNSEVTKLNNAGSKSSANITLIKPDERLIKKEEKSVVVRTVEGKLVRRTASSGILPETFGFMEEGEVFVAETDKDITVLDKNEQKKVRLKHPEEEVIEDEIIEDEPEVELTEADLNKETPAQIEAEKEAKEEAREEKKERLMSKYAFLERLERGERVGGFNEQNSKPMEAVNTDLVEEIEDSSAEPEVEPDKDVVALENAVTDDKYNRTIGNSSSKGVRSGETVTHITSTAINPNEKPNLKGTAIADGLVGNSSVAVDLPKAEPVVVKKPKKKRKPLKPWVVALSLASIYIIGMLVYFFVGFNFGKKKIDLVLYYISIGENAKLEYYDGEHFNSREMLMTYYYSDDRIETSNLSESNFAETTVGMGYTLNKGNISALWVDSFKNAESRSVKVKFVYNNLVCYVPVTIYRNKLTNVTKQFNITSLEAGLEINPTLFAEYTNKVISSNGGSPITGVLDGSKYTLKLNYEGNTYDLKALGYEKNNKYTLPETIGETTIDYTSSHISLYAEIPSDGFNPSKMLMLYS